MFFTRHSDNRTLNANIFTLISGASSQCVSNSFSTIGFGQDKISGCLQNYSGSTQCSTIQSNILSYLVTPPTTSSSSDSWYVAEFGNTAESATDNWILLTGWEGAGAQSQSASAGCTDLVVGLNYTVLYANTGSLSNPQAKITGIEVSSITKTFQYECYGVSCNSEQFIEVITSVTFIDVSTAPAILLRQRPTVDARLPSDFFFPFTSN